MSLGKFRNEKGLSFHLEIFDENNRRIEKWRHRLKDLKKILDIISDKYDLPNNDIKKDRDLDWLK